MTHTQVLKRKGQSWSVSGYASQLQQESLLCTVAHFQVQKIIPVVLPASGVSLFLIKWFLSGRKVCNYEVWVSGSEGILCCVFQLLQ